MNLGVGIVGYGMMGRAHAYAYRAAASLRPGEVELVPVAMSGRILTASPRWPGRWALPPSPTGGR